MVPVLYEDNHCLALDKPAGLLAQGDATGEPTLLDAVRAYLKDRYRKPGNVFVGLVHRLDRPTSGVMLLARTSKAAGRLAAQFREGAVEKTYRAVVEGSVADDAGEWCDVLLKDERRQHRRGRPGRHARRARGAARLPRAREGPGGDHFGAPPDDRKGPSAPRPARLARLPDRRRPEIWGHDDPPRPRRQAPRRAARGAPDVQASDAGGSDLGCRARPGRLALLSERNVGSAARLQYARGIPRPVTIIAATGRQAVGSAGAGGGTA